MASKLPEGDIPPVDGSIPLDRIDDLKNKAFSFYLHVPYCASRCGYCDFNTYTLNELGEDHSQKWLTGVRKEIELAKRVLGQTPRVSTIFIGGGTPTLLPASDLVHAIEEIKSNFGFQEDIEITTEANPDSVSLDQLRELHDGGLNRISFGMQSAVSSVLKVLERTHSPENVAKAVEMSRAAGFEQINLDLIYGTPGESIDDLQTSLDTVLSLGVNHISAYALIVEEGTRLARAISTGAIPSPDDDDMADKYKIIDDVFRDNGFDWYEVSNWAKPKSECQHNIHYWQSDNWWGIGPGAHSHINGVRWWNEKLPRIWTEKLNSGISPANAREVLDEATRKTENIMLQMRLASGMDLKLLQNSKVHQLEVDGLVEVENDSVRLTFRGRLLADRVIDHLTDF